MVDCRCTFVLDKSYLCAKHGILDLLKIACSLACWISLLIATWNSGVINFMLTWCCVSWISTVIWFVLIGFCMGCLETCFAVRWVPWPRVFFWWNAVIGGVYVAACICGIIGTSQYRETEPLLHTTLAVACGFASVACLLHLLDAWFYNRQTVTIERRADHVAI